MVRWIIKICRWYRIDGAEAMFISTILGNIKEARLKFPKDV